MNEPIGAATPRQISPMRVVVVLAGLAGSGAVAGAGAGILGVSAWLGLTEDVRSALDLGAWGVAGIMGAALGAVLLPIAGFTALRRVPLGQVFATTILATAAGGVAGVTLFQGAWLQGAVAGFALAVATLWGSARSRGRV